MENLGYPVIDINKFLKDYPTYFSEWRIGSGSAESFSFADYERYQENSCITKKVKGGFSLNLGLFSIGSKRKMSEVFTKSIVENKNCVFGELSVQIKDSCYNLQVSSNIMKKIRLSYLTNDFKEELYNTTPSELFSNYGGFVLSRFVVGGKAVALYTGLYKETDTTITKEKNMNTEISGSYGFKMKNNGNGGISADLGIGKDFSNGTASTNQFTSLRTSIRTVGGSPEFASFSIPQDIKAININLSAWVSSLNNKSNHSIIEISEGGLIPLADFIVEENLKNMITELYAIGVNEIKPFQEPYINIRRIFYNQQITVWASYLVTRFGDEIMLRKETAYFRDVTEDMRKEAERLGRIFGLKIVGIKSVNKIKSPDSIDLDRFEESRMKKIIDARDGTIYLLYTNGTEKYAYSIRNGRLLDEYVMRDFVNRLPTVVMEIQTLYDQYKIFAF